jgi:hypothetical protein
MGASAKSTGVQYMPETKTCPKARDDDRIDIGHEYELCAWARHFNASEQHVKEAVAAVGDRAGKVREHLMAKRASSERPSA